MRHKEHNGKPEDREKKRWRYRKYTACTGMHAAGYAGKKLQMCGVEVFLSGFLGKMAKLFDVSFLRSMALE